jgi:hypothetical protein
MTDTATVTKLPARPEPVPEDKIHGLLNDSIAQIANGLIEQTEEFKKHADALQKQVVEAMADAKEGLRRFQEVGEKAAAEVRRGQEAIAKLSAGISKIGE